ncbi:MAG: histidine phosphotransferase [Rhodobacterales bacterium]|nr:MAG: histidine phosphotransferase [Rhodobacterales bacterium]
MNTEKDIAALIGSRICHDLISPIGAIGNGVELLSMAGSVSGPEMSLISESVANANARIRFFRIAFGAAQKGQIIGQDEVAAIIRDLNQSGRVQIEWSSDTTLPRDQVKLVFLLIQCCESAMPYGGTVKVQRQDERWGLSCNGRRIQIDPLLWQMLISNQHMHDVSPSNVHFALVPGAVQQSGRVLQTELSDSEITLQF